MRHSKISWVEADEAPFSQRLTVTVATSRSSLRSDLSQPGSSGSARSTMASAARAVARSWRLASSAATPRRIGARFAASRTDAQLFCCALKILRCEARHLVTARLNAASSIATSTSLDSSARSKSVEPSFPVIAVSSAVLAGALAWRCCGTPVSRLVIPVAGAIRDSGIAPTRRSASLRPEARGVSPIRRRYPRSCVRDPRVRLGAVEARMTPREFRARLLGLVYYLTEGAGVPRNRTESRMVLALKQAVYLINHVDERPL